MLRHVVLSEHCIMLLENLCILLQKLLLLGILSMQSVIKTVKEICFSLDAFAMVILIS